MNEEPFVYCPVCTTAREKPKLKPPILGMALTSALWGAVMSLLVYLIWDSWLASMWSGFVTAMLSFLGIEGYYTHKFRRELVCPVCEFDPILFRSSPEKAKEKCLTSTKRKPKELHTKWAELESMTPHTPS